jgi:hypothetical protein
MHFFMRRVAQPVASSQGSVAYLGWWPRQATGRRIGVTGAQPGGKPVCGPDPALRTLTKATSLGGGARLGSGPQTTFATHEKVHHTL